jgi:hypothetical protein
MKKHGCDWDIVDAFQSDDQYERLLGWLTEQVRAGAAREEPVKKRYSGVEWDEHWYRCLSTRDVWRLIAPDPPFKGLFKPVNSRRAQ